MPTKMRKDVTTAPPADHGLVQIQVRVSKPQHDYLKAESERLGISIAEKLRRIVDDVRDRRQP